MPHRNPPPAIIEPDPILRASGYVSIATAAALLQVSPKTVQAYINKRYLDSTMSGNNRVMKLADVTSFKKPANGYPKGKPRKPTASP